MRALAPSCSRARERIIACWAMGLTQHEHAVANIQEVVNLLLLRGNIGRPGAGLCPVRGHSNVQGDRTMGIWTTGPGRASSTALARRFGFVAAARATGSTPSAPSRRCSAGRARLLFALGGNFLSAAPDTRGDGARRCAAAR